jgi:TP901 family phage tail tape measure protein
MATNNKQFEVKFVVQALDQAGAVLTAIRAKLEGLGQSAQQVGQKATQAGNQIAVGLQQAQQAAEQLRNKIESVGQSLVGMGVSLAAVGGGMLAPVVLATKSAGDFEHAMNKVRAVANMTPEDFKKVTDSVRQMGATTVFSSTQAAGGLLEISRAGYNATQAMATLPTVLQLAAAEEQNAGEVAEGLINILNGFGLKAEDASRAGDVLSRTSNDTTTSMRELTEAFKFVGPIASTVGMSLEQTAASLGVLSNNGIKGSEAGTGLRRMIEKLSDPTGEARNALARLGVEIAKQSNGNVDLAATFDRLQKAGLTAKDAFQIFGVYGATSAVVLTKNREEIEKLTTANQAASGSLKEMTNVATAGMNAALTRLSNAFDELVKTLGTPFLAAVKGAADWLSGLMNWISATAKEWPKLSAAIGYVMAGLGAIGVVAGLLVTAMGGLFIAVAAVSKGWAALGTIKQTILGLFQRSSQAIRESTAVLNANTQAVTANASAQQKASLVSRQNQAAIDALNVPYSGRTGRQPTAGGAPVATPGQQPGSGGALGWKIMADGGAKATVVMAGLSAVLSGSLNPGIGTMGDALANTGTTLGTLAMNIGFLGPVMGTIATGFSSWVQVIPQLSEALAFLAQDTKDAFSSLPESIKESLNAMLPFINYLETIIGKGPSTAGSASSPGKNAELAESFISTEFAKAGGIGSGGINYKSIVAEFKKAFGDKALTADLEKALSHAYFQSTQSFKKNMEQVGNELAAQGIQGGPIRTLDQQIGDVKAKADIELKTIGVTAKQRQAAIKQEDEQTKASLTASIQSEQLRAAAIQNYEIGLSARRIQIAQDTYAKTINLKEAEIEALRALYTKQAKEEGDKAQEANQKLIELDKQQTELRLVEGQKLTDSINQELDKQLAKRTEYEKKIQDLATQSQDVQKSTADALRNLQVGAASEYDQLKMKLSDAQAKLKQAADLMPTFPERAMKLAQDAQQAFAGLGQNIAALQQNMKTSAQAIADAQRSVATSGLTGTAKWLSEVQNVQTTIQRAREAQAAGQTKEAEAFYKQALGQAQGVGSSSDVSKGQAQGTAQELISTIGSELLAVNQGQVDTAKQYQEQATKGVQQAGQLQLDGIKNQMDATKALIIALEKNTEALTGQRDLAKAEELLQRATTTAAAAQTGPNASTSPLAGAPTLLGAFRSPETAAIIGPADAEKAQFEAEARRLAEEQTRLGGSRNPIQAQIDTAFQPSDEWRRSNSPDSATMLRYDYEDKQRMATDPTKERAGLLQRAYDAANARKQEIEGNIAGAAQGRLDAYQGSKTSETQAGASPIEQGATKIDEAATKHMVVADKLLVFADKLANIKENITILIQDSTGTLQTWSNV